MYNIINTIDKYAHMRETECTYWLWSTRCF